MSVIRPQKLLVYSLMIMLVANLAILFNIPFLRSILGFLAFSFLFGMLALLCFKIEEISISKCVVYSFGLSVAFLMLFGLLINYFLPVFGISKPLSFASILLSFDVFFILLWVLAYFRNKESFSLQFKQIGFNSGGNSTRNIILMLIPLFFLVMAIFGVKQLDTSGSNFISMLLIILIATFIILLAILNKKNDVPDIVFYSAIFFITLSILFAASLHSGHLFGCDVHGEYFIFGVTQEQAVWQPNVYSYNPCISITILPVIYSSMLGLNDEFIFTIIFQILFAFTPLIIYMFLRKYAGKVTAFLSVFFLISFNSFMSLGGITRTEIACLFFVLAILAIFDESLDKTLKKSLFMVFSIVLVLSHYTIAYIFFGLLLAILAANFFTKKIWSQISDNRLIIWTTVILFMALIFFWYGQMTSTPFNGLVKFTKDVVSNLVNPFLSDLRSEGAISAITLPSGSLLFHIDKYLSHLMKLLMIIGLGYLVFNFRRMKIDKEFVAISGYMLFFVGISIFLPMITKDFNIERILFQALLILCFCCILGAKFVLEKFGIKDYMGKVIIASLIVVFFLFQSGFVFQIAQYPSSSALDTNSLAYRMNFVHEEEVESAKWLSTQSPDKIYADHNSLLRIWSYGSIPYPYTAGSDRRTSYLTLNSTLNNAYVYLRYDNVANKSILIKERGEYNNIPEIISLLEKNNKIYDNGGSWIFRS